ncbi:MAG TPA: hypothetical protein VGR37_09340, partial [Longimicrobiaceae bacterium]|nr:hypothetical protein [Longimicrobiaceae bacterium]
APARPMTPREMEAATRAGRPPAEPRAASTPAAPPTDWIEVRLVGEDDRPIPGVRWVIVLPDGSRRQGRLDGDGVARVEGIPSGTCRVSFPELDRDAWVPL